METNAVIVTCADWEAYALLCGSLKTTDGPVQILEYGNRIIALAERIKAQRLAVAMQD